MATYSVKLNFENTWYEVDKIGQVGFKRTIKLLNSSLKSCINSCKFVIEWTPAFWSLLLQASEQKINTPVVITKNGLPFFKGVIPPGLKSNIGNVQVSISLNALDNSYLLKSNVDQGFSFENMTVCNPLDVNNSLVHQLFYKAGFTNDDLDITHSIPSVVSLFSAEKKATYWKLLSDLLYEFCHVFNCSKSGKMNLFCYSLAGKLPVQILGDDGWDIGNLVVETKPPKFDSVDVIWWKRELIENAIVYRENINPDSSGEAILAGFNYPVVNEEKIYKYSKKFLDYENAKILRVNNCDTFYNLKDDPDVIESTVFRYTDFEYSLHNKGSVSKILNYFEIKGDVFAQTKECSSSTPLYASNKEIKARHIENKIDADNLAVALQSYYMHSESKLPFMSEHELIEGYVYKIVREKANIDVNVLIVSREESFDGIVKYSVIPLSSVVAEVVTTKELEAEISNKVMIQRAVNEELGDIVSFNDLVSGHDKYGKTTTPFKLEKLTAVGHQNAIELSWAFQSNLSNLKEYRLQVSHDKVNWYALQLDGSDWKSEQTPYTVLPGTYLIHTKLKPWLMDDENVVSPIFYYRVSQVTVKGAVSPWSDIVESELSLIDSDIIVRDSIRANHIKSGEIQASHLSVNSIDAKSIYLLGSSGDPSVKMRDLSILYPLVKSVYSTIGHKLPGEFLSIEHGHPWSYQEQIKSPENPEQTGILGSTNGDLFIGKQLTCDPIQVSSVTYQIDNINYTDTLQGGHIL